jgi:uncharacterized membrane protein
MGKRRDERPEPPLAIELPVVRREAPEPFADGYGLTASAVIELQGPIPLPGTLEEYERLVPGLAGRLVDWAESESEHRREMERSLLKLSWAGLWCALAVTLVTIIGSMVLSWAGRSTAGLIGGVGAVAGLVIVFVAGRRRLPADRPAQPLPSL